MLDRFDNRQGKPRIIGEPSQQHNVPFATATESKIRTFHQPSYFQLCLKNLLKEISRRERKKFSRRGNCQHKIGPRGFQQRLLIAKRRQSRWRLPRAQ